jgi:hypothetical protein
MSAHSFRLGGRKRAPASDLFPVVQALLPRMDDPRSFNRSRWSRRLASTICAAVLLVGGLARAADMEASATSKIGGYVEEASSRFGIPASWIEAVMRIESGGKALAVSPKGAIGLMQIMPQTWKDLRQRYLLGSDPFDPHDNVAAGAAYLRDLFDLYGSPGFLEAYNAGPGRYEDHLAKGRPLPTKTTVYIAKVAASLGDGISNSAKIIRAVVHPWTEAPLFSVQFSSASAAPERSPSQSLGRSEANFPVEASLALQPRAAGLFVTGFVRTRSR